jgi:hypothetical protein
VTSIRRRGNVYPTRWDWLTYVGTIGLFLSAMFLFVRICHDFHIRDAHLLP